MVNMMLVIYGIINLEKILSHLFLESINNHIKYKTTGSEYFILKNLKVILVLDYVEYNMIYNNDDDYLEDPHSTLLTNCFHVE